MALFGSKSKPVVGLDIGSSAVKAVELKKTKDGYELTAVGLEPRPAPGGASGPRSVPRSVPDPIRDTVFVSKMDWFLPVGGGIRQWRGR